MNNRVLPILEGIGRQCRGGTCRVLSSCWGISECHSQHRTNYRGTCTFHRHTHRERNKRSDTPSVHSSPRVCCSGSSKSLLCKCPRRYSCLDTPLADRRNQYIQRHTCTHTCPLPKLLAYTPHENCTALGIWTCCSQGLRRGRRTHTPPTQR